MVLIEKHFWTRCGVTTIDFGKSSRAPDRFVDIVDQKTGPAVFDHLAAGAKVHRDHGHTGGIRFRQDEPNRSGMVFRCSKRSGPREQFIFFRHAHRTNVADFDHQGAA